MGCRLTGITLWEYLDDKYPGAYPEMKLRTLQRRIKQWRATLVALLGGVYEHSPWVDEAVVDQRPFLTRAALQQTMKDAVERAETEAKLSLLKAHPEFAGKPSQTLTESSTIEQGRLSLNRLPAETCWLSASGRSNGCYCCECSTPKV